MRIRYIATASPIAVGLLWVLVATGVVPVLVALVCAVLVVATCTLNGWDHPRFKGRMHPGAAFVRGTTYPVYKLHVRRGGEWGDLTGSPTRCVEWCLVMGLLVGLVLAQIPWIASWAWWFGAAVAVGCASHVVADLPTPSGVPVSALYNRMVHQDAWHRHSLGWFDSDEGGEHFWVVPVMFAVAGLMVLGMLGVLDPMVKWMVGA